MQTWQQNYNVGCLTIGFVLLLGAAAPAEPLLHDGGQGACDSVLTGPDLVAGVDVSGHAVPPAGPYQAVPVPDQVLVPLKRRGRNVRAGDAPLVALDGRTLDPLLNPPPACVPGGGKPQ